jgi:hypothetical protein
LVALEVVGRHRLADGDVDASMLRLVDLGKGREVARAVDDGDGDRPVVLLGLGFGRGQCLLGGVKGDAKAVGRRWRRGLREMR